MPNCYSWDQKRIRAALSLLDGAIECDPQFGPALALSAVCHHHLEHFVRGEDAEAHRRAAMELGGRALRVAPNDATTIGNVAAVFGFFDEDITRAIMLADRRWC
jgi:adenylate cyclase